MENTDLDSEEKSAIHQRLTLNFMTSKEGN